ncbi:hypothetical protein [Streptomyces lonarensis]|uniref:Uncharacterized protein n=1 Tax=Streptomyces lonarensis TaxID=700599 RepID=A0A7X6D1U2_9ACTN|nr:hypothetical protein [Streptomyces lonarensis]NJQ06666.1 hypothetical protein [Streptomyces lonarensis]
MTLNFTVDITGTTGMRTGEWADGEEFLILPDQRMKREESLARVRLCDPATVAADGAGPAPPRPSPRGDGGTLRQVTVAEVEERMSHRSGEPHPVLVLSGPDEARLCVVRPGKPGVAEPGVFDVTDEDGAPLGRIEHRPSRPGRRAFWRIVPREGPVLTGYRGSIAGWAGFVLTYPLWLLFFFGSLLVTLLSLGNVTELLVWGAPRRVAWHRRGARPLTGTALDFRYMRSGYRWRPELLDHRLAYAQASLHYFHKMHKD